MQIVYQKTQIDSWGLSAIHPFKNIAYVPNPSEDSLLVIDFRNSLIQDHKIGLATSRGTPEPGQHAAVSKDGKILILTVGQYLQLRDAETFEILREYYPNRYPPYVHPDGERIFFLEFLPLYSLGHRLHFRPGA